MGATSTGDEVNHYCHFPIARVDIRPSIRMLVVYAADMLDDLAGYGEHATACRKASRAYMNIACNLTDLAWALGRFMELRPALRELFEAEGSVDFERRIHSVVLTVEYVENMLAQPGVEPRPARRPGLWARLAGLF